MELILNLSLNINLTQMKNIIINVLAVLLGLIIGSVVNGGLIQISGTIIPPPAGIDVTTEAGLRQALPLFEPKHFIFPFLAHALGTLIGAFFAALIATSYKLQLALIVGFIFLIGGIWMVFLVPSPIWFTILDLLVAYIPMALIGSKLIIKKNEK